MVFDRTAAVILAGGKGSRMGGQIAKQYLPLCGKPLIYYALKAYEESNIDDIVLVADQDHIDLVIKDIVSEYGFQKVKAVVPGGEERFDSVLEGLNALREMKPDYVLIHDGARALIPYLLINNVIENVKKSIACAVGLPSKDTVRLSDLNGCITATPSRDQVWLMQTPQAFSYPMILDAYEAMRHMHRKGVTDDCAVLEANSDQVIKLLYGSERNFKITTPEDFKLAEALLNP